MRTLPCIFCAIALSVSAPIAADEICAARVSEVLHTLHHQLKSDADEDFVRAQLASLCAQTLGQCTSSPVKVYRTRAIEDKRQANQAHSVHGCDRRFQDGLGVDELELEIDLGPREARGD